MGDVGLSDRLSTVPSVRGADAPSGTLAWTRDLLGRTAGRNDGLASSRFRPEVCPALTGEERMRGADFSRRVIGPVTFETAEAGATAGTGVSPLAGCAGSGSLVRSDFVEMNAGALERVGGLAEPDVFAAAEGASPLPPGLRMGGGRSFSSGAAISLSANGGARWIKPGADFADDFSGSGGGRLG